jgi:hypothetical protein
LAYYYMFRPRPVASKRSTLTRATASNPCSPGYWEAKDTDDDLAKEIEKKRRAGPLTRAETT